MGRFRGDLPDRTYQLGLAVIRAADRVRPGTAGWVLAKQLIRSGTSIGANICEAHEALSDAEFRQRCSIARKEASETRYWLGQCRDSGLLEAMDADPLIAETDEIMRILVTIIRRMAERKKDPMSTESISS
jgi:four helix bundle protein